MAALPRNAQYDEKYVLPLKLYLPMLICIPLVLIQAPPHRHPLRRVSQMRRPKLASSPGHTFLTLLVFRRRLEDQLGVPGEVLGEDGSNFTACLRLIRCSRIFLLPDLTAHAQNYLYAALQQRMIEAQTAFYVAEDSDEQFAASELAGFFEGVKKVYEDEDLANEKEHFIHVVKNAHFWPLLDSTFERMVRDHPVFWAEVMSLQQTAITDGAYWPYWKPEECHNCEHSPWQLKIFPRSTHWATLKLAKGKCQATCNRCASEEEQRQLAPVIVDEEEPNPSSERNGEPKAYSECFEVMSIMMEEAKEKAWEERLAYIAQGLETDESTSETDESTSKTEED
ncbi:hypothetical protein PG994_002642 [Apiospora phragmitis]|uniref:Uncharacterized protein n=1 Tax=Apiospora phragmitis TaxID=2905665 RepID=A0ABR1W5Q3_9PEZI